MPLLVLLLLAGGFPSPVAAAQAVPSARECEELVSSLDYARFLRSSLGGELSCIVPAPRESCCVQVLGLFGRTGSAPLCLCNEDFYSAWMAVLPGLVGVNPDTYVNMLSVCKVPIQGHAACPNVEGIPPEGPLVQSQILSTLTALLTGTHQGRIGELVPWITDQEPQEAGSDEANSGSEDSSTKDVESSPTNILVNEVPDCSSMQNASGCSPVPENVTEEVPQEDLDCQSLVHIARDTPELTAFVQILDVARLASALQDGFIGTLFAPSNSAFAQLLEELGGLPFDVLIDPENEDILTKILKTHVVPGVKIGSTGQTRSVRIPTLLEGGQNLSITAKDGDLAVAGPGNNMSIPVEESIMSCSSVLHILSGVLLPSVGLNRAG